MQFAAAALAFHSMVLVILVTRARGKLRAKPWGINCLHERRRLHTPRLEREKVGQREAVAARESRLKPSVRAPFSVLANPSLHAPGCDPCEYLVTVNYTRYRFIFSWQIRATIPWVFSPPPPRLPSPYTPCAHSFVAFCSSIVGLASTFRL